MRQITDQRVQKALEREVKRLRRAQLIIHHNRKTRSQQRRREVHLKDWGIVDNLPAPDNEEGNPASVIYQPSEQPRIVDHDFWSPGDALTSDDWKLVAVFKRGQNRGLGGGHFLAVNHVTRSVTLATYDSGRGCSSCGYGALYSSDGMQTALGSKNALTVRARTFLKYAEQRVDPAMRMRRIQPSDIDHDAIDVLYATYEYVHSAFRGDFLRVAWNWRCRRWTDKGLRLIIKLQAAIRGWYFRHRILYNPHTELGRRFLLAQWRCFDHDHGLCL